MAVKGTFSSYSYHGQEWHDHFNHFNPKFTMSFMPMMSACSPFVFTNSNLKTRLLLTLSFSKL